MASRSTQSPRYNFEPILYREPVRFPRGQRLAVLMYVNIEHVPFGSTALAHAVYPGTLGFSPDILNHGWRDYGNRVGLWRIMSISVHPFISGHPFRMKHIEAALGYIASHPDLWLTTGVEINNWYRASYLTPRRAA